MTTDKPVPTFFCDYLSADKLPPWLPDEAREDFLDDAEGDADRDRRPLCLKLGDSVQVFYDGGEPEDNLFRRDWNWVRGAIREAYLQGRADSAVELRADLERQLAARNQPDGTCPSSGPGQRLT